MKNNDVGDVMSAEKSISATHHLSSGKWRGWAEDTFVCLLTQNNVKIWAQTQLVFSECQTDMLYLFTPLVFCSHFGCKYKVTAWGMCVREFMCLIGNRQEVTWTVEDCSHFHTGFLVNWLIRGQHCEENRPPKSMETCTKTKSPSWEFKSVGVKGLALYACILHFILDLGLTDSYKDLNKGCYERRKTPGVP